MNPTNWQQIAPHEAARFDRPIDMMIDFIQQMGMESEIKSEYAEAIEHFGSEYVYCTWRFYVSPERNPKHCWLPQSDVISWAHEAGILEHQITEAQQGMRSFIDQPDQWLAPPHLVVWLSKAEPYYCADLGVLPKPECHQLLKLRDPPA